MTRKFLRSVFLGSMICAAGNLTAQVFPPSFVRINTTTGAVVYNNHYADYVGGARFSVNTPASVSGAKTFTIANDGSGGTGEWGGAIVAPIINAQVIKAVTDTLACTTLLNGTGSNPSMTGKIGLVFRGDCEFSQKALAAQTAGAIACIIVNNVGGGPVGMGAGSVSASVTIPVIMISQDDGIAIANELNNGANVTISIAKWGLGANNDLGIIPGGLSLWHNYAIPYDQLGAGNGNPSAYKYVSGAFVGNFGSQTHGNLMSVANIRFHPDAGGNINLYTDSSFAPVFNTTDSIIALFPQNTGYDIHATAKGRFDVNYEITSSAEDIPEDNSGTVSFYATEDLFSKGRYDFANEKPITNISFGSTSTTNGVTWGPLYFVSSNMHGGQQLYARNTQFTIAIQGNGTLDGTPDVNIFLCKWNDMDNNAVMTRDEMSVAGIANKQFTTTDTSFDVFTAGFLDSNGVPNPIPLSANTWYWLGVDVPTGEFLGCDGLINYYVRSYSRQHVDTNIVDSYAPMAFDNWNNLAATEVFGMYPFESFNFPIDSVGFAHQKDGLVPAVTFRVTTATAVNDINTFNGSLDVFPNPAVNVINAKVSFDHTVKKVRYTVYDGMGQRVTAYEHSNVKAETFAVPTQNLVPGTYYLVVNADTKPMFRKFTIIK